MKKKKSLPDPRAKPQPLLKPFSFDGWGYKMPLLGVAEYCAQLAEVAGDGELAAWWRRLMDFPEADAKQHYDDCERDARQAIDTLLARAEKFDGALLPVFLTLHHLLSGFHALAAHGNKLAGRMLM